MQLSRLSQSDMLTLSQTFVDPVHPAGQALSGVPELASLLSRLRETHQVLLAHPCRHGPDGGIDGDAHAFLPSLMPLAG